MNDPSLKSQATPFILFGMLFDLKITEKGVQYLLVDLIQNEIIESTTFYANKSKALFAAFSKVLVKKVKTSITPAIVRSEVSGRIVVSSLGIEALLGEDIVNGYVFHYFFTPELWEKHCSQLTEEGKDFSVFCDSILEVEMESQKLWTFPFVLTEYRFYYQKSKKNKALFIDLG